MSYMFEVYYKPPRDSRKEAALTQRVSALGGRLDYWEEITSNGNHSICLTYDFDELERAETAAEALRESGEHVEGPQDYGP
jgi:hypothetical protein